MEENKIVTYSKNNSKNNFGLFVLAMFIGAIFMFAILYFVFPKGDINTIINKSEKEVTVTDAGIADAVEKLYDAVVVVEVYKNKTLASTGTGFVYKTDNKKAYILTNEHVINGGETVKVILTNNSTVETKVEGNDKYSDLAVLSMDKDKIVSVAELGKSTDMRLGDTVFTVGAPLDTEYYWTVTRGILSGKDRMVEVSGDYIMKVLQTDASINSGNSGGPLANSNGEVVGITNMKLVSSGVEGIGFAIPIEDAINFADAIISGKDVRKPLLGITMIDLSDRFYLYQQGITLNTELTQGVVVIEVQKDSPAEKASLKRGDIVISVDGNPIKNVATLRYYLYKHSIGDSVNIEYERSGKKEKATMVLNKAYEG